MSVFGRFLMVTMIALTTFGASAQSRDPAADAQALFSKLMSPYCPGLLLSDCPSAAAFELRRDIRRRLEAGESATDIERDLYRQFGDSIRAVPVAGGAGRWLMIAPPVALVVTLVGVLWYLARARAGADAEDNPPDAAMNARLRDELDRLD